MKKLSLLLAVIICCFNFSYAELNEWKVLKSTHFFIYYKNAPEDFIKNVSEKSEKYYNQIADGLGFSRLSFWLWDDRAKIYIYDDAKDYRIATGEPNWSYGAALPGYKIIRSFAGAQYFLDTTLPHELSHIIFREFVGFNNYAVTLWLEEGVATYQEKIKYQDANKILKQAIEANIFLNLKQLSRFRNLSYIDAKTVKLFYLESFSLIDFLIGRFGKQSFVSFCRELRDRKSLTGALSCVYHFSDLGELESAWRKHIQND